MRSLVETIVSPRDETLEKVPFSRVSNSNKAEKDAVRFPKITLPREFPLYYLRVEIEILSGAKDFYDKIGRMCY
jgi:hypothetical protein